MEIYTTNNVEQFSWLLCEGGVNVCIKEKVKEQIRLKDELEFVRWKEECYGIIQTWHFYNPSVMENITGKLLSSMQILVTGRLEVRIHYYFMGKLGRKFRMNPYFIFLFQSFPPDMSYFQLVPLSLPLKHPLVVRFFLFPPSSLGPRHGTTNFHIVSSESSLCSNILHTTGTLAF